MSNPASGANSAIDVWEFQVVDAINAKLVGACREQHLVAVWTVNLLTRHGQFNRVPGRLRGKILFDLRAGRKLWRERDWRNLSKIVSHKPLVEKEVIA